MHMCISLYINVQFLQLTVMGILDGENTESLLLHEATPILGYAWKDLRETTCSLLLVPLIATGGLPL